MESYWDALDDESKDILRAVKLLDGGGISSIKRKQLEAVLANVFRRSVPQLADRLDRLADDHFLERDEDVYPIRPDAD